MVVDVVVIACCYFELDVVVLAGSRSNSSSMKIYINKLQFIEVANA